MSAPWAAPSHRPPGRAWTRAHGFVLALLPILSLVCAAPFLDSLTDDTFLRLQFAKHLATGRGCSFSGGEPTYGAESPLWIFLVAAVGAILPGGEEAPRAATTMPALAWVARGLAVLFHAATILLLPRLGRRLGWDSWTAGRSRSARRRARLAHALEPLGDGIAARDRLCFRSAPRPRRDPP